MSTKPTNEKVNDKISEEKVNEVDDKINEDKKVEDISTNEQTTEHKVVKTTPPLKKGSSFLTSVVPPKTDSEPPSEENIKKAQEDFLEKNFEDEILFKSKCKLFAYNKTKKKMEERGVGDIMISKDKKNNMVKVVMIRESVMRFGCNHYINPKFKLEKHSKIVNALVWATTEDTVDPDAPKDASQIFLVKFDEEEVTTKFKEEFDKGSLNNKSILESK